MRLVRLKGRSVQCNDRHEVRKEASDRGKHLLESGKGRCVHGKAYLEYDKGSLEEAKSLLVPGGRPLVEDTTEPNVVRKCRDKAGSNGTTDEHRFGRSRAEAQRRGEEEGGWSWPGIESQRLSVSSEAGGRMDRKEIGRSRADAQRRGEEDQARVPAGSSSPLTARTMPSRRRASPKLSR